MGLYLTILMGFYLMVFDVDKAPKTKTEFLQWYKEVTDWKEEDMYDDITISTTPIQEWFYEMIKTYPPMNGKFSPTDEELDEIEGLEERMTDYSIGDSFIYMEFAWSVADKAYDAAVKTAFNSGLGVFYLGTSEEDMMIILPDNTLMTDPKPQNEVPSKKSLWDKVKQLFCKQK